MSSENRNLFFRMANFFSIGIDLQRMVVIPSKTEKMSRKTKGTFHFKKVTTQKYTENSENRVIFR